MADIIQIQESEYDAILRQAVAVIDRTRTMVATTVCSAIGTAHWGATDKPCGVCTVANPKLLLNGT